jgi:hypothetical protein
MLLNEYELIEFMFRKIRNIRNLGNVHIRGPHIVMSRLAEPMRRTNLTSTLNSKRAKHIIEASFNQFRNHIWGPFLKDMVNISLQEQFIHKYWTSNLFWIDCICSTLSVSGQFVCPNEWTGLPNPQRLLKAKSKASFPLQAYRTETYQKHF